MTEEKREGVYVYGVTRAGTTLDALDREKELPEAWLIEAGELAALASDLPKDDEAATRDHVMAHSRVLATAIQDATIVPMRFGMIFPSDEAIRNDLLEGRGEELAQLLERLEGRLQMTLKVYYDEERLLREIVEQDQEVGRLREAIQGASEEESYDARVRLGELVNAAIGQRRERDAAEILEELKPTILAAAPEQPEKELMVLNAPLLIDRERRQEFEERVDEIAREREELMHFKLLGPMPAYHFLDAGEPAWA